MRRAGAIGLDGDPPGDRKHTDVFLPLLLVQLLATLSLTRFPLLHEPSSFCAALTPLLTISCLKVVNRRPQAASGQVPREFGGHHREASGAGFHNATPKQHDNAYQRPAKETR